MAKYSKRERKNTSEYQRILEILDDYWLSEQDEYSVDVDMHFVHGNGEEQFKHIRWINDQLEPRGKTELTLIPLVDILRHGEWIHRTGNRDECSNCGARYYQDLKEPFMNFCPNCGIRMVGD